VDAARVAALVSSNNRDIMANNTGISKTGTLNRSHINKRVATKNTTVWHRRTRLLENLLEQIISKPYNAEKRGRFDVTS
jgi:hypothetical protein